MFANVGQVTTRTKAILSAHWTVFAAAIPLFLASSAVTVAWCRSMDDMAAMPMPGDGGMSSVWMPMPGQTWLGVAASFLLMWVVMTQAMMLPSLTPMLVSYRRANERTSATELGRLTVLVASGYFLVWTALGVAIFPAGAALVWAEVQSPALMSAIGLAAGLTVVVAGALQFTRWKARQLACCLAVPLAAEGTAEAYPALKHGLRLGIRCTLCCAGPMAVLLAIGMTDLRAMAIVAAAITIERVAPAAMRAAQATGGVMLVSGLLLIVRATGFA